jgi:hypothetical protein
VTTPKFLDRARRLASNTGAVIQGWFSVLELIGLSVRVKKITQSESRFHQILGG